MLPCHLILYSMDLDDIKYVIEQFPQGLFVKDDDGNLPLHLSCCSFYNNALDVENKASPVQVTTLLLELYDKYQHLNSINRTNSQDDEEEEPKITPIALEKNNKDQTTLHLAIYNKSGWEMLDTLLSQCPGSTEAASELSHYEEEIMNNALHLLLNPKYTDDACIVTLLKHVPILATIPNSHSILSIEIAYMNNLSNDIILAISLLDLLINLYQSYVKTLDCGYYGAL